MYLQSGVMASIRMYKELEVAMMDKMGRHEAPRRANLGQERPGLA